MPSIGKENNQKTKKNDDDSRLACGPIGCISLNFRTNHLCGCRPSTVENQEAGCLPACCSCIQGKRLRSLSAAARTANHSACLLACFPVHTPRIASALCRSSPPRGPSSNSRIGWVCGWFRARTWHPCELLLYRPSLQLGCIISAAAPTRAPSIYDGTLSSTDINKKAGHAKCCPRPGEACARCFSLLIRTGI